MKSRFKSTVRDLALAIGLASALIVLFLVCLGVFAPPAAASPKGDDLWPAWTSTEPTYTLVGKSGKVWPISDRRITFTFPYNALTANYVFTFAPQPDLKLDPPLLSTDYMFWFYGTYVEDSSLIASPQRPLGYDLHYEESQLRGVSEDALSVYFIQEGRWYELPARVDTTANRIRWDTPWTGQFGIGGYGTHTRIYFPAVYRSSRSQFAQAESEPAD